MGWGTRPQLTEYGACFDVSEARSASVAQGSGVHIADSPQIPLQSAQQTTRVECEQTFSPTLLP